MGSETGVGGFSGPFAIAAARATGKVNWDSYKLQHDSRIRTLLLKIICAHDPDIGAAGEVFTSTVCRGASPPTFPLRPRSA